MYQTNLYDYLEPQDRDQTALILAFDNRDKRKAGLFKVVESAILKAPSITEAPEVMPKVAAEIDKFMGIDFNLAHESIVGKHVFSSKVAPCVTVFACVKAGQVPFELLPDSIKSLKRGELSKVAKASKKPRKTDGYIILNNGFYLVSSARVINRQNKSALIPEFLEGFINE